MTGSEMELVLVANKGDADEGFILASSTWPKHTTALDKLVAAGRATVESEIVMDGKRVGANYRVRADALRPIAPRRRSKPMSPEKRAETVERLRQGREKAHSE